VENKIKHDRAALIEKCAEHFGRRAELNFDLLAEVGVWNRFHPGSEIALSDIHEYHEKLVDLLKKARTFTL
jgi:hypothetical protein